HRARRLVPALEAVVAERALPDAAVLLLAEAVEEVEALRRARRQLPLVEDAERTGGNAVTAAVADVLLDDDGAELGSEQGSRRADVETGRVRAVLADVRGHEPPQPLGAVVDAQRLLLFDESDVAPGVRVELAGVVVGLPRPLAPVLRHEVPLLARDLARLAADADRGVGEEADARLLPLAVLLPAVRLGGLDHAHVRSLTPGRARVRNSSTRSGSALPRGRRPGRMPTVNALTSWMCTFGSRTIDERSLAASPVVSPRLPQWYGRPIWCVFRPWTTSGLSRGVTKTRASTADRGEYTVAQPP